MTKHWRNGANELIRSGSGHIRCPVCPCGVAFYWDDHKDTLLPNTPYQNNDFLMTPIVEDGVGASPAILSYMSEEVNKLGVHMKLSDGTYSNNKLYAVDQFDGTWIGEVWTPPSGRTLLFGGMTQQQFNGLMQCFITRGVGELDTAGSFANPLYVRRFMKLSDGSLVNPFVAPYANADNEYQPYLATTLNGATPGTSGVLLSSGLWQAGSPGFGFNYDWPSGFDLDHPYIIYGRSLSQQRINLSSQITTSGNILHLFAQDDTTIWAFCTNNTKGTIYIVVITTSGPSATLAETITIDGNSIYPDHVLYKDNKIMFMALDGGVQKIYSYDTVADSTSILIATDASNRWVRDPSGANRLPGLSGSFVYV